MLFEIGLSIEITPNTEATVKFKAPTNVKELILMLYNVSENFLTLCTKTRAPQTVC